MSALEWFAEFPEMRKKVAELTQAIESAHASAGPHGQSRGTIGGGGGRDALAGIDRIIDSDAQMELRHAKAALRYRTTYALWVLYGRSGRGGLAKARSSTDADILCCHYLQGVKWVDIATDIESASPRHWCQMRARRACGYIDRVGMAALVDS